MEKNRSKILMIIKYRYVVHCIWLLLFILVPFQVFSVKNELPVIRNFTKSDYQADGQNWSVAKDNEGIVYFANNKGLLEFDGVSWLLHPSPNGNIIRCVATDGHNRIYTSGYRELGYWERDQSGKLSYTSLTPVAEQYFIPNVEFWDIIPAADGKVYFHSFTQILIWENGAITPINLPKFSNSMVQVDGKIVVDMADGLYFIDGKNVKPMLLHNFFNQKQVRFVFKIESKLIVGTASDGLFIYDHNGFNQLLPEWNEYFIKNKINRAALSPDGKLVIGTILDGIIAFDLSSKMLFKINTPAGLQNNTVLGIAFDKNHNIWLALDRGIDFVSFKNKGSYALHTVDNVGAVYTSALYNGNFYLGTNQGLFVKANGDPDERFTLVPQTQGQVWYSKTIGNKLFIGHNNGTFVSTGGDFTRISTVSGAFSVTPDTRHKDLLMQSTYTDIIAINNNQNPSLQHNIDGFSDLIQYLEVDLYGNLWAGHMHRGVYKIVLSDDRDKVLKSTYFGENSVFGKDYGIHPFKIDERIVFATGEKLYTYDELKDSIVDYQVLNQQLGKFAAAHRIFEAPNHHYWFVTNEAITLFTINENQVSLIKSYPSSLFNNQIIENFENITPISEKEAILSLENGYAFLWANQPEDESLIGDKKLKIREFITADRRGINDTLPPGQQKYVLGFNRNNAQIKFSFPLFSTDRIKFQAYIDGIDPDWRSPVSTPLFRFERLPEGKYTLYVKAIDSWGAESETTKLQLTILPPWYLSNWAKASYTAIILFLLLTFRQIIINETRRKEKRKREEKEKELIRLRNEKLQDEISFKSQDLANTTMAIIKKNEFLLELKSILKTQKSHLDSRFPDKYYLHLVKKIDENISNQDDWKTFETNFERAHEAFVKKLKGEFPKLTPGDLRICAYLKMNLSSKEIAPLLGISVRGVENHRYRLRKKMGLDAEANLNEVLLNL